MLPSLPIQRWFKPFYPSQPSAYFPHGCLHGLALWIVFSPHGIAMPNGLYFTAVLFSFFVLSLFFSTPNLWGHWTNLSQTWTHINLWLLFEKFGPNSPGHLASVVQFASPRSAVSAFAELLLPYPVVYWRMTWLVETKRRGIKRHKKINKNYASICHSDRRHRSVKWTEVILRLETVSIWPF